LAIRNIEVNRKAKVKYKEYWGTNLAVCGYTFASRIKNNIINKGFAIAFISFIIKNRKK